MDRAAITKHSVLEHMLFDESVEPTDLPLSLLEYITNGFSDDKQIGRGGFAVVYKGMLRKGTIAVKKLVNMHLHEDRFQQEVQCLMKAKHKNIVRFLGYCADTQGKMESYNGKLVMADVPQRLLCFEYLPKGSLHDYITDTSLELQWKKYYQIIKGICMGLHYLHENRIVHLDLKPANILLDANMVPKIADFGLSRCFDEKQTHVITSKLFGSLGYLAPEFHCGRITFKSDIYSLGVIIIEILTGEKMFPEDYDVLESWGNRLAKLHREKQLEQLQMCAEIGRECTDYDPKRRPDARTIVHRLEEADITEISIVTDKRNLSIAQEERARRITEQDKMFSARKLCLVLNLDHTLLNSAKFIEVDSVHEEILRKKEEEDSSLPERHLYRFHHMNMWTKLRPGIWNFLDKASKLFELHLCTMGNKLYATEMAKVLDPTGTLFAGRVISGSDDSHRFDIDERLPKSKDLDGMLEMESAVVIIDDSVGVWPHNRNNLIVVERYTYFSRSRRQFGLPGPSLLEIDRDERPEDGTLASSLAVIERIHQNFFSHSKLYEADVRTILSDEQKRTLAGCRIVFSRIFPVQDPKPHLHPLWQTAEQFGAVCTNQVDDKVTHVVANSLGTEKVNWALATGRFVVDPGWVEASALLYRRANELDFLVR